MIEHLPDQETIRTIREGREARELLTNPVFVGVMNELSGQYLQEIINSDPHETKTREDRYLRIRVLNDITNTLINRVALAERAEAAAANEYDPDTEEP